MKAAKTEEQVNETPYQRFQRLIRGIVAVPKKEIEAEEARWRANRAKKKKSVSG